MPLVSFVYKNSILISNLLLLYSGIPHTGLKKEALNIVLILIKRLSQCNDIKHLTLIRQHFLENLPKFQKDSAPEIRCRIKDIEEKFTKAGFQDH